MDSVFRDIRRKDRVLSCDAAWKLLERGEYGFLAMQGMNGYGYGIPLSYAMRDRSLYFHCAPSGFKLDSLDVCDRVSFCVVGRTLMRARWLSEEFVARCPRPSGLRRSGCWRPSTVPTTGRRPRST